MSPSRWNTTSDGFSLAVRVDEAEIVGVVVAHRLDEIQVSPAALLGEGELTLDGAAAEDLQRHPLGDIRAVAVQPAEQVGAHRARALPLRPVHPEVGDQGLLVAEEVAQRELGAGGVPEAIGLGDHRALGQAHALLGQVGHGPAELDLLLQEVTPRRAISVTFAGEERLGERGEFGGRAECEIRHDVSYSSRGLPRGGSCLRP